MKLVIIFGPHAVGKMTVGQELAQITELKLFHNHMSIEIVSDLFENLPSERSRLTNLIRKEIFESYSKSENRLLNKPSKRNLEYSENLFIRLEEKYRLNSNADEISKDKYIKINNTNLSPNEVAELIKNKFAL